MPLLLLERFIDEIYPKRNSKSGGFVEKGIKVAAVRNLHVG
jgi:hypothetical protein